MQSTTQLRFKLAIIGDDGPDLVDIEYDMAHSLLVHPSRFIVVVRTEPAMVGGMVFASSLEHLVFPVENLELNKKMLTVYVLWCGTAYMVLSLPREYYESTQLIALRSGLVLRHRVIPMMISSQTDMFPFRGRGVFSATQIPGHLCRHMNTNEHDAALQTDEQFAMQWYSKKWFTVSLGSFISYKKPKDLRTDLIINL